MDIRDEIITLLNKVDRLKGDKLIKDLDLLGYFISPASTNKHNSFEGGLALHSYNVYKVLKDMNNTYHLDLDEDFIIVTSLLHDMCKLGVYEPNILKNGEISETKPYKYKDSLPLGHGEKSVIMLSEYIRLTPGEAIAIRYHIGPFSNEIISGWNFTKEGIKKSGYFKEVMALYHADSLATSILEDCGLQSIYHSS
jgi:hypothetical protein|tara:strand:+ start:60 stop:647 length:588 start_codon:yes stop_codon:yes gene_type:complete